MFLEPFEILKEKLINLLNRNNIPRIQYFFFLLVVHTSLWELIFAFSVKC